MKIDKFVWVGLGMVVAGYTIDKLGANSYDAFMTGVVGLSSICVGIIIMAMEHVSRQETNNHEVQNMQG